MGRRGFTLTEVLIAVTLVGILASASVANYVTAVQRTRWDTARQILLQIYDGENQFFAANNAFVGPITCATLQDGGVGVVSWRRSLNMDHPCPPGVVNPVTYAVALIAGPGFTVTATNVAAATTQTIDQNRTFGGTWVRP